MVEDGVDRGEGLTRERLSTSLRFRTSKREAWPMACFLRASTSWAGNNLLASVALIPCGNVGSSATDVRADDGLFNGLPSARFFGRPLSMIVCPPSDSPLLCPMVLPDR